MSDRNRRNRWRERSKEETDRSYKYTKYHHRYTWRREYNGFRHREYNGFRHREYNGFRHREYNGFRHRARHYSPHRQHNPIQNNEVPYNKKDVNKFPNVSQYGHQLERNNEGVDLPSNNIPQEDHSMVLRKPEEETVKQKCGIIALDMESVRYAEEVAGKLAKRNIQGIVSFMKEDTISTEERLSIVARRGYPYAMFISEQNQNDDTVFLHHYNDRKIDVSKILPTDDAINIIAGCPDNHKREYDDDRHHSFQMVKYEYNHHNSYRVQQTEYVPQTIYDQFSIPQTIYDQLNQFQMGGHQQFVENNGVNVMNKVAESSSSNQAYPAYIEKLLVELLKGKVLLVEQYDDVIKHVKRCQENVQKRLRADRDNCIESGRYPEYRQRQQIYKSNRFIDSANRMNPNGNWRYKMFKTGQNYRQNPTKSNFFNKALERKTSFRGRGGIHPRWK